MSRSRHRETLSAGLGAATVWCVSKTFHDCCLGRPHAFILHYTFDNNPAECTVHHHRAEMVFQVINTSSIEIVHRSNVDTRILKRLMKLESHL